MWGKIAGAGPVIKVMCWRIVEVGESPTQRGAKVGMAHLELPHALPRRPVPHPQYETTAGSHKQLVVRGYGQARGRLCVLCTRQ